MTEYGDYDRDRATANILQGWDAAIRHPAIAEEAAKVIIPRLLEAPPLENLFSCRWDFATERLLDAQWICRGSANEIRFALDELEPGQVACHNHPGGSWPEQPIPSEADLTASVNLAARGIGSALITNDLRRFVLLRPPRLGPGVKEHRFWRVGTDRLGFTIHRTITRRHTA